MGCYSKRAGAFSLVEVVLALGLVTFAVTAVIGLLPTGLSTLRQAMNQTVEAQIVQTIGAQSVIAPFTQLAGVDYFDDEGLPTSAGNASYTVNVSTNAPVYPGATNAGILSDSLTALKIQIIAKSGSTASGKTNFYTLQMANAGK